MLYWKVFMFSLVCETFAYKITAYGLLVEFLVGFLVSFFIGFFVSLLLGLLVNGEEVVGFLIVGEEVLGFLVVGEEVIREEGVSREKTIGDTVGE